MKGDLHTLKKVCMYASKAMMAGEVLLAAVITLTLAMGIGSAVSDGMAEFLDSWVEWLGAGSSEWLAIAEFVVILLLGMVTVHLVKVLMLSVYREYTPFTADNVELLKHACWIYLAAAVLLPLLELATDGGISGAVFMFLGTLMVSTVMYCLALVFRYGGVLQKESDETL